MNLAEVLRGLTPGTMQSVGRMQVIPLTGEEVTGYGIPSDVETQTTSYGTIGFIGHNTNKVVIPQGTTYITKHAAQDHALPHTGIFKGGRKFYDTAACIERSQGGYIPPESREIGLLPFALKQESLKLGYQKSYSKLWNAIGSFNLAFKVPMGREHLVDFMVHYTKELDTFVAQFEPVSGQLGAIILLDGIVIGIERMPNYAGWLDVWRPLIRECYGSQVLKPDVKSKTVASYTPISGLPSTIAELAQALQAANDRQREVVKETVNRVMAENLTFKIEEQVDDMRTLTLESGAYVGQVVQDGDLGSVYCSVIATEKFMQRGGKAAFSL